MPRGHDLWRNEPPPWGGSGSFLLLNPRLDVQQTRRVLGADFPDLPDHVWLATSGTGGRLKIVALARAALEASARAVNTHLGAGPGDVWLDPLPLFHVGGLGIPVRAAVSGARWQRLPAWRAEVFAALALESGTTLSSLVPAQVHDIVRSGLRPPATLRAVVVGGGVIEDTLLSAARGLGWPLLRSYGLTEASSQVATESPAGVASAGWLPLLGHVEARVGVNDLLEVRGPSLLTGWLLFGDSDAPRWQDPKTDGWLVTGDRAELRGGLLRVLGRADDLHKIRGELVDVAALERKLQAVVFAGAVCVLTEPDERNGTALRVIAENGSAADEARSALGLFPPFARPASVTVGPIRRTALGKIAR